VDGGAGARTTYLEGEVRVTSARLNSFEVNELVFPPSFRLQLDPVRPYVAAVVEGSFLKTFVRGRCDFAPGSVFTMPQGAFHTTRFGRESARVVCFRPIPGEPAAVPWEELVRAFRHTPKAALGTAARLAAELRAEDDAWALAAEGLCLELVAGVLRNGGANGRKNGSRRWLEPVRERLHARDAGRLSVAELAGLAGVHPGYLSRAFREHYGMTIGDYLRRLRLDRATSQLAATDVPIAIVAAEAGFADQSHFTRAFKRHTGVTPARYRRTLRS
jgi:AraC family transcriptional regulator